MTLGSTSTIRLVVLGLLASQFAGCGSSAPPLAPVRGRVTFDGRPLAKVRVEFHPEVPINDPRYVRWLAQTDENGEFIMKCDNGQLGVTVGWHRVVLATDSRSAARERNPFEPETGREAASSPSQFRIPREYNSVATTPERHEVKPDAENNFDLKVIRR